LSSRPYLTLIKPAPNNKMEEAKATNASSNVDSCNSFIKREIISTLLPNRHFSARAAVSVCFSVHPQLLVQIFQI